MPKPKHPRVVSLDEVRITREGDAAVIRYADDSVAVTHFTIGAEKLTGMSDQDTLDLWNGGLEALEQHRQDLEYVATEVPVGKPQVSYFEPGNQWTPVATSCAARFSPTPPSSRPWRSLSSP